MSKVEETAAKAASSEAVPLVGAVFDLDGTLLGTEEAYLEAYTEAARSFGKDGYTWDTVHYKIVGKAELEGAQIVVDALELADVTPEAFLKRRDEFLLELLRNAKPLLGALAAVRHMKACCKKVALATSSYKDYCAIKREKNEELFSLFDAVICGDNPKIGTGKPSPDIFLVAAEAIGIDAAACIAFEDSAAGVKAATSAGMRTVAIPDPRLPKSQFERAEVILKSLEDFDPTAFGFPAFPDTATAAAAAAASE